MADDDETDNQPVVRKRIRKKRPSRATVPGRGRGQPRFQPTVSQRHTVTTLAGFHMTHDQMAMLILNEKTGKPISKNALEANFKEELRSGQSKVKMVMATKFMEIINQGNERAILWAMERIWKIPDPNRTDTRIGVAINDDGTPSDRRLSLEFILPSGRHVQDFERTLQEERERAKSARNEGLARAQEPSPPPLRIAPSPDDLVLDRVQPTAFKKVRGGFDWS